MFMIHDTTHEREPSIISHICMASSPSTSAPPGIRPSLSSFSNLVISCRLFASRINFSTRLRSLSVSCTRTPFSAGARSAGVETSKVRDLTPRILDARDEGSSEVPKSSLAVARSASVTFWKSRKRTEGMRQMSQYR